MTALTTIAKLPEVRSAVLGDLGGAFLDAVRETDGETVAAVTGYLASLLVQAGEQLGLGSLRRLSVSGERRALLVIVDGKDLVTVQIDPPRALAAVEKAIETSLPGQG
jgi:predicted regulator of Ras-like GTPase activity (Roadblock/LC7/MglB family)